MTLETELAALVARAQSEQRVPSVTAALVVDGEVVACAGAGTVAGTRDSAPVGPDTQYRIGSISKTFTAVLVMRLRDEGRLDLEDRLDDHLPGTAAGRVTLAQLLSHTSGLRAETDAPWWERSPGRGFDELAPQLRLVHPPGERLHYSNLGFAVLARVVEQHRGRSWEECVQRELLEPLGLGRTTVRPVAPAALGRARHPHADLLLPEPEHHHGAMAAAGQLWSTPADLARWGELLRSGHPGVLPAETAAQMRRPRGINDLPGQGWGDAFGLGVQLSNAEGRRRIGHGGSMPGFLAVLRVGVADGRGVVALTNVTSGLAPRLVADLEALLDRHRPAPVPTWYADPGQVETLAITGTWYWGPAPFLAALAGDGRLTLTPVGPGRHAEFVAAGPGRWLGTSGYWDGEELRVVRDRTGSEVHHLDLASFRLTRQPYDPTADLPGGVTGEWG